MNIINLTPHPVTFLDDKGKILLQLERCQNPARVTEKRETISYIEYTDMRDGYIPDDPYRTVEVVFDIPVNLISLENVENLPEPQPDTVYIVSRVVAQACSNPDDGFVIACKNKK